MDPNEKLRIAKLKVLNGNRNMRLFSCLLYKFEIFTFDNPGMTAFVTFYNNKFGMYFEKTFINSNTTQELVYIIIHEQCHVLNNHLERGKNKDNRALFNIATDHVINDRLDTDVAKGHLNNIKVPESRVIVNYFKDKNVTAEEVYEYLLENAEYSSESISFSIDADGNCTQSGEGEGEGDPENQITVTLNKIKVTMPDGQVIEHIEDVKASSNQSSKEIDEATKNIQSDAKSILNSNLMDKKKGSGSSGIIELIREAVEVPLPWDELVENAIKSTVTVSNDNKSWKNINKRLGYHNIQLAGYGTEEKINKLIMCIDTSGSMSVEDFRKFVHIIQNSVHYFSNVIKIDHDYKITDYREFTADEILMNAEGIYKFTGRGGTSHSEVFEKIEDLVYEHDEDVSMVFFLTDYESDIEQLWNKFEWTKEIPVKFILTTKHHISEEIDKCPIYI